jgi:hypothetical protein
VINLEISDIEIKELINGVPECPVETLLKGLNEFDGSDADLDELYKLLKWIETHEGELSKLRRMVEKKIIDQRFKDVKV